MDTYSYVCIYMDCTDVLTHGYYVQLIKNIYIERERDKKKKHERRVRERERQRERDRETDR